MRDFIENVSFRNIRIIFFITCLLVLFIINFFYYHISAENFKSNQDEKIDLVINNTVNSIEMYNKSEDFFNNFLSNKLKHSSSEIKESLPKNINDISNERLELLSKQFNMAEISLLVKNNDTFTVVKSSDERNIGITTKSTEKTQEQLDKLYQLKSIGQKDIYGDSNDFFWSSPIDYIDFNPRILSKLGFYYDGDTNYIVNVAINEEVIKDFKNHSGIEEYIKEMKNSNEFINGIAVVNTDYLHSDDEKNSQYGILYGEDNYQCDSDFRNIQKAIENNEKVEELIFINGKKILKKYVPTSSLNKSDLEDNIIIIITSDYDLIENELKNKSKDIVITSAIGMLIGLFLVMILDFYISINHKNMVSVQEMYLKNVENLFTSIKEYRHDFKHQLSTISGLEKMGMYDELKDYVNNLMDVQLDINDIININIPAFSGLMQSKIVEATEKRINFEHHFENFEKLKLDIMKITDLVRIVGNILDNSFHAVLENPHKDKKVVITGRYHAEVITINIYNNGPPIPDDVKNEIFSTGYTTKKDKGGKGLGLSSSNKIIKSYKGSIKVYSSEEWTRFSIYLPVSTKEIL